MPDDEDLWSDEINAFVDAAFESGIVSRNPSDAEEHIAYRYAIKLAMDESRKHGYDHGYYDGSTAAASALEADAMKCDCFAYEENECACGAWADYKTITSARAVEIVRALQEKAA